MCASPQGDEAHPVPAPDHKPFADAAVEQGTRELLKQSVQRFYQKLAHDKLSPRLYWKLAKDHHKSIARKAAFYKGQARRGALCCFVHSSSAGRVQGGAACFIVLCAARRLVVCRASFHPGTCTPCVAALYTA